MLATLATSATIVTRRFTIIAIIRQEAFALLPWLALGHIGVAGVISLLIDRARRHITAPAAVEIEIVVEIFALLALVIATATALLVLPRLVVGDHAEVMVGKLEVVLHLHPITIVLGVLRQLLVLLEQLGRIATRAAVYPVKLVAVAALSAVTAPTATVIAIVIQGNCSLISGLMQKLPARAANRPLALAPHRWALPTRVARSAPMWPRACPDGRFS